MVGGTISGYSATGRLRRQTRPSTIVMIAITLARIGRSMKNLDTSRMTPSRSGLGSGRRGQGGLLRADLRARNCLHQPLDNHPIIGANPPIDHHKGADLETGLDG